MRNGYYSAIRDRLHLAFDRFQTHYAGGIGQTTQIRRQIFVFGVGEVVEEIWWVRVIAVDGDDALAGRDDITVFGHAQSRQNVVT